MTEVFFAASGPYHHLKVFEAHMQSQRLPIKHKDPVGNELVQGFFGMLEPIQLYRYVCTEDSLGIVLKTLKADQKFDKVSSKVQFALRKALGLSNIPNEIIPRDAILPVATQHIQIMPIGVKREPEQLMTHTGIKQEPV